MVTTMYNNINKRVTLLRYFKKTLLVIGGNNVDNAVTVAVPLNSVIFKIATKASVNFELSLCLLQHSLCAAYMFRVRHLLHYAEHLLLTVHVQSSSNSLL